MDKKPYFRNNLRRFPLNSCNCLIILVLLIGFQFDELIGWKRRTAMAEAFEVLPFVHIDYAHYLRLAECQAKCSQKIGDHTLLDGSNRLFCNTSSELYEICEMGCSIHMKSSSTPFAKHSEDGSILEAFNNGQVYWRTSIASGNGKHNAKQAHNPAHLLPSPIEKVRVLCLEKSTASNLPASLKMAGAKRRSLRAFSSNQRGGALLFDTYEAILSADLKEEFRQNKSSTHNKYIVQWRQKHVDHDESQDEETKWITSSIEPSSTFKVHGLQHGVLYRFMVTVITPSGKYASESSKSDWIDFGRLAVDTHGVDSDRAVLSFHSQYNLINNVGAVVRWVHFNDIFKSVLPPNHPQLYPTPTSSVEATKGILGSSVPSRHAPLLFEGCRMQIEYSNKTITMVEEFTVDESGGFLLKNLGFNVEYSVEVKPRESLLAESHGFQQEESPIRTSHLRGKFLSMSCSQVYGPGSLECDPEPVRNVEIRTHPENGTVGVQWSPSTEAHHILLYQLYYLPVSEAVDCALEPTSQFLTANSTSASLPMPTLSECEFELRIVNYDLLGREATTSQHFVFTPNSFHGSGPSSLEWTHKTTFLVIVLFLVMGLALFVVIKFAAFWPSRLKKASMRPSGLASNRASISSTISNASSSNSTCSTSKRPSLIEEV